MPAVNLRFFAAAAATMRTDELSVDACTLGDALSAAKAHGEANGDSTAATVIDRSSYLLNRVSCADLTTGLSNGDQIDVLPPFAGG
ncbi:MoaD/ThiS family protein [Devriesea agamarum]|uniref:MoaD/ThiS family protein n=1 Tax=Devriesea agamarum TaxID=472569 RepID=UPI00071D14A3|nr:MoaD/ThiS family protein [Devriesea agamarum]